MYLAEQPKNTDINIQCSSYSNSQTKYFYAFDSEPVLNELSMENSAPIFTETACNIKNDHPQVAAVREALCRKARVRTYALFYYLLFIVLYNLNDT